MHDVDDWLAAPHQRGESVHASLATCATNKWCVVHRSAVLRRPGQHNSGVAAEMGSEAASGNA
jgi:hypothetical protein